MSEIHIVGTHPATREMAPFDNPEAELWIFNETYTSPWTKGNARVLFQMHPPEVYRSSHNRADKDHWRWLQQNHGDLVIYMLEVDPLVPNSRKYPLKEVCYSLLSGFRQGVELKELKFFTSSIAYALALAITKRPNKICVYGVENATDTEYIRQRDCIAFYTGIALGKSILVDYYGGNSLFNQPAYGYEGDIMRTTEGFDQRAEELRELVAEAKEDYDRKEAALSRAFNNGNLSQRISELINASGALGKLEGHLHEIEKYASKVAEMLQNGGTAILDRNEYEAAAGQARQDAERYHQMIHRTAGRLDYTIEAYEHGKSPTARLQLDSFTRQHINAGYAKGFALGIFEENLKLTRELDNAVRAAGGRKHWRW